MPPWEKYQKQPEAVESGPWEKYQETTPLAVEPEKPITAGEVATGAMTNLIPSAGRVVGDIANAVIHPIETGKSLYSLAGSAADLAIPGEHGNEDLARNFGKFFSDRYGGIENVKKTIAEDPAGFLLDVSTILTGGGAAASKLPGVAGKVGETVSLVGKATDPINIAKVGMSNVAKVVPAVVPEKLYASSLKMGTTIDPAERAARIKTGLDRGIMPNPKGLAKLQGDIDRVNGQIHNIIEGAAKKGDTIDADAILSRLDDVKKRAAESFEPQPLLTAIDRIETNVKAAHGQKIPVDKAQRMKINAYRELRNAYGELKSVDVEARKSLARGVKEELATKYTDLAKLNAEDSALMRLEESLERAVNRIQNRDVIGIGAPIKAIAGSTAGMATTGLAAAILDFPQVKAALAVALRKAKLKPVKSISPMSRAAYQSSFQTGRTKDEINQ